jgi:hypothetical protein
LSLLNEYFGNVFAGYENDRVAVFSHFLIGLAGGDRDAKLTVSQPRDHEISRTPRRYWPPSVKPRRVTFGFERKVYVNGIVLFIPRRNGQLRRDLRLLSPIEIKPATELSK